MTSQTAAVADIATPREREDPKGVPLPMGDPLFLCIAELLTHHGNTKPLSVLGHSFTTPGVSLSHLAAINLLEQQQFAAEWRHKRLDALIPELFPVIVALKDGGYCLVLAAPSPGSSQVQVVYPIESTVPILCERDELMANTTGLCLLAKPDYRKSAQFEAQGDELGKGHWLFGVLTLFRGFYAQAALASVLVNVLAVSGAFYAMNIYDRVIPHKGYDTLLAMTVGVVLALFFEDILKHLRTHLLERTARRADYILSNRVFNHLLASRLENIPSSPGAMANMLREYESVREFLTSATLTGLADLPFVLLFLALVAWVGGWLAVVPMVIIVIMVIGLLWAQKPLAAHANVQFGASASRHGLLLETIEGLETAKSVKAEGVLVSKWDRYNELIGEHSMENRTIQANIGLFISTMQQGGNTVLLCVGAYLASEGLLTSGVLIAAAMLNGRILAPIAAVGGLASRYQQARKAFEMLDKFMQAETDREHLTHRVVPEQAGPGALTVQAVDFAYPQSEVKALDGIHLHLAGGMHLALLGEVGSGKSTLLRLLAGLYKPSSGTVLLDGVDISQLNPTYLRSRVGVLSQEPRLFSGTLMENLMVGGRVADDWFLRVTQATGVHEIAARHPRSYQMMIGDKGCSLSGGQKQLIAWARMLMAQPDIVLMDEPTSALDPASEQRFVQVMRDYLKGRTAVLITHKLNMLDLVERVAIVKGGKIEVENEKSAVLKPVPVPTPVKEG